MDFPFFHLAYFGDRLLIGVIGALHVIINHAFAVGAIPLIVLFEWLGQKKGDERFDAFAKRLMTVCFMVTTTVGALTGVGIWLSIALVNPEAIGSLLRVFFWAWFTEWLVFITEVCLILAYYLTWKKWTGERKGAHIRLGLSLAIFSWITMALIVAILGFMMIPGAWVEDRNFFTAMLNQAYIPQLAFRTALAMTMAGALALSLARWCAHGDVEFRTRAVRILSLWTLGWIPLTAAALAWYVHVIPADMWNNLPTALGTQAMASHYLSILSVIGAGVAVLVGVCLWGLGHPRSLPSLVLIVPMLVLIMVMGVFERSREFLRKPYVIGGYMYANRFRVEDYPLLQHDGILRHSAYASVSAVTPENQIEAGHEIFRMACATCHTVDGVNGIVYKLDGLYGGARWEFDAVRGYLTALHGARPYMPPFPGNDAELDAVAHYLVSLQPPAPSADLRTAAKP